MTVYRIQVAKRGVITLPQDLRKQRDIQEGEVLTLLDLNGVFVLTQKELETDRIADRLGEQWLNQGASLETMLNTLREVRNDYTTKS